MVPQLLQLRVLRSARFVVSAAASPRTRVPNFPWAPSAVRRVPRGSSTIMAVGECSPPPRAESQRLETEAGGKSGENGQPLPTTSHLLQQTDGRQIVEQKKKQRKKQKEESHCLDSIDCLMLEMPFTEADIEDEFCNKSTPKPNVKKKRKRTAGRKSEEDNLLKKKKENQDKPNYFISVPITNPKITDGIQLLQNKIIQKDNRLSKAMVHYGSLHVTLLVMHLSSEEAIDNAVGAFMESEGLIEELLQRKPLDLSFQGIDHFRNQVGFVKLRESDHAATLLKISEIVKKIFKEKGIFTGDDKAFKPHLTFMKLSKSLKLRKQGVKRIDPTLFESFKNHHFGDECMKRLDLCSMLKKKQPNGYYHCESSIIVGEKRGAEPDDAELLSLSKKLVENAVLKAVQQYLEETQNKNRQTDFESPLKTEEAVIGNRKESEDDNRK
ncbi:A-kinase anchoring protein 7 isoform X3 [Rhineura floridana]|uniref:A-kinase anchoring protein 7 isoform X3 n=1 Tax=Rhineura floridana TaxID=261503 RepID=UPI002AC858E3|nr:A-kinase anchoring protein 7 isoform X3 [Rhineura floridana]